MVLGGAWLWLHVQVGIRFERHSRPIPSHVYSDVLVLSTGDSIDPAMMRARLERVGYARTEDAPDRPGRFRVAGDEIDIHLRAFSSPTASVGEQRIRLHFREGRVASIQDARGREQRHLVLEPELLGTLYGRRHEERTPLRIDDVPERAVAAVLAAEDARFYRHSGLDLRGIARAALTNARHLHIVQGGSTITQQTVKNLFLDPRRTWWRKAREAAMALVLDGRYPKSRILEVYLNEVYLGQRGPVAICGIQAGARHYFGRGIAQLSLAEQALLAGLIRSPGRYDPYTHPERALARREQVLQAMVRAGSIDAADASAAADEPLVLPGPRPSVRGSAWVVDFVVAELARTWSDATLREDGLGIHTTVDPFVLEEAERSLEHGLARIEGTFPEVSRQLDRRRLQGAIVVTRPATGEILALVGGRDWSETQFNRAVLARRQPGSCFKPFVFAAAFEAERAGRPGGLSARSRLEDAPLTLRAGGRTWSPRNYDGKFHGKVTVREALERSLNVPTVRAAQGVGLAQVIETAKRCGIRSPLRPVPSLALGTIEVTPLELAEAYGTLAQDGIRVQPWIVRSVTDSDGRALAARQAERVRAIDAGVARQVDELLRGVVERGTARSAATLGFRGSGAGKTGTTDDTRDAWFVGYTADRLALVWVGYDDNARTGLTGATGALPIWADLMARAAPLSLPRRTSP